MSGCGECGQDKAALLVLAAVGLALITILSVWKLKQFKYRLINETGGAMFYGMLLGLIVRYLWFGQGQHVENAGSMCTCNLTNTNHILLANATCHENWCTLVGNISQQSSLASSPDTKTFDPEVLFILFLPPIIFHAAYTLNQKRFIENLGSVLTYAFLGTIISCMCIGACVYGFTRLMVLLGQAADGEFSLTDCLLFGAIMSATDPVSVLGLLSDLRVDLDLHILLFGESVLNDAAAVVLTHAISEYNRNGTDGRHIFDAAAFLRSVGLFVGVLVGSFVLGFIFTVVTALLTKFTRLHENPLLEASVFFLLSWSSYLSAEACGLSGVVAVLFCGLSQARYTNLNLSSEGGTRTKQLFEFLSFLGEISIFIYMGYILLAFPHHVFKALFISGAFLSIFISRAFNIYPLSFLLNLRRSHKIPRTFQHFMMFAGFRGAIAFNLAARNTCTGTGADADTRTEVNRTIYTTTLLLVGFTIWVLGTAADPMLRRLDIRVGVEEDEKPQDPSSEVAADTTQGLWHCLDYKYLKPLLTRYGPPLTNSLPQCCSAFARVFSCSQAQEHEMQLCETEPDDSKFDLEKADDQLPSTGGDSRSDHQEDLLEGDLGLGSAPAPIVEGESTITSCYQSPLP